MTERRKSALTRSAGDLAIGRSRLHFDGTTLVIDVDEVAVPLPRRVKGRIRLHPQALGSRAFALDAAGRHRWMPLAPAARVEATFSTPGLSWSGHGYWDTNAGDEPIARAFSAWTWSRAPLSRGSAMLYDVVPRAGAARSIAVRYKPDGSDEDFAAPPPVRLRRSLWGIDRETRAEDGQASLRRTLEDTPFYARSELRTRLLGEDVPAVHESLSCDRFDTTLVRLMLPWRMPRRFV